MVCFNCGKTGHRVSDCRFPINQQKIDANKLKFQKAKNDRLNLTNSKWKPPTPSEQGKRIIGDNPFTFNIPKNKWVRDNTPPSGLAGHLGAATDEASIPPKSKVPPVIDTSEEQPSDAITTASTVAQLQVQMAALQRKLAAVQDTIGG